MVSRAVGAGNIPLANHIVLQAGTITAGFAILMMIIGVVFTEVLLRALGVSNEVIAEGAMYMRVQFIGQGVTGFQMLSGHALSASGDTLTPMKANVVSRILHLALSPLLIFGWFGLPAFGLAGAAWANIIAHAASLLMILIALFGGSSRLHLTLRGYRLDGAIIKQLLKIGTPASVNSMERSLAQLLMVWLVAPFGDFALAAYSLTRRVEMFANLGSQGLGQASGIIVGQSLGAGKPERARETVLWATGYVMLMKTILGGIMFTFPVLFLSIFTTDPELLSTAKIWLQIQVLGYIAMGIGQVAMQSFQTAGDTIVPMLVTLFSMYAVEVPLAIVLTQWTDLGQFGVAWAIVAAMLVRPLIYIPYFFYGRWLRIGILNAQMGTLGARRGGGGH
jgi:putative MATE family efflux protein